MRLRALACCLLALAISQAYSEEAQHQQQQGIDFQFSRPLYNVSIPENSVAKTYATPVAGDGRVGVRVPPNTFSDIRFKIVGGDRDRFFKAEDRLVGDFCFLFIRTRTGKRKFVSILE